MTAHAHAWLAAATGWLPRGRRLSHARWSQRHRVVLWVLWPHLPVLALVGVAGDHPTWHVGLEIAALALGATVATLGVLGRVVRTVAAVVTLVSCSAVLVHLTDGLTESHFHFFAVVAFVSLYEHWLPFGISLGYVLLHHGVLGVWSPGSVYSHEAAWARPVLWAFVHGGFVLLVGLASLAAWRLTEIERENVERVLGAAADGIYGLDRRGRITFVSPVMCDLLGADRATLEGRHHHEGLGHHLADGRSVEDGDCPLCSAVHANGSLRGEACLRGAGDAKIPVEYLTRPMDAYAPGQGSVVTVRDLRESRRWERQRRTLEEERDRLASVVEASPDVIVVGQPDGTVAWMNTAGEALLGLGPVGDGGHRIEDLFSPAEMARIYAEDMPVIAGQGAWRGTWTLHAQDGAQIPVSVAAHLHPGTQDHDYYVSAIMRDLRPRLAEERERLESERRLAAAEGVAGIGSWEWDLATDKVMWSLGMYRLHGMEPGDGNESFDAWLATLHPDDRDMALGRATQMRVGRLDDFTYRAVRADGRVIVIHARGEMVRDEQGRPSLRVGTLQDITERHAAAEALRLSEERARSVIATAGDAYVQFDGEGLVTEWNHQAEATFGWGREEVVGRSLSSLVLDESDREAFERRVGVGGPSGQMPSGTERFELLMLHRSRQRIPVEVTAWVVRSGDAQVFSCFIRDISERLAAERAKDEFVSVVGHELRTPLTAIHGALGLLRAGMLGDLNERGGHMVDIAAHNTDRLVRLINDILDIERLNSGAISLQPRACDIASLVEQSIEAMRPVADEAGVLLDLEVDGADVWADPDRVEQTLTNLLSNAIKFSPRASEVRVTVRDVGADVSVEVRDHGRGIPSEDLERIFDRFQQVDGSDSREKGGTGLGLAICRSIVEQHGGRIWAQSSPGVGSTLTFTLPLARPRPQSARQPTSGARPRVVRDQDASSVRDAVGLTLLLVEDDQDLADVLTERFTGLGIDVRHAPAARDALAICRSTVPDLLVLDLTLPDQDGFALVAQLRTDERFRRVPLAVYSACDLSDDDRGRLHLGATRYLTKGRVSPGELERHVIELLDPTEPAKEPAHGT
jgi:PAS domain S-box-containing protein